MAPNRGSCPQKILQELLFSFATRYSPYLRVVISVCQTEYLRISHDGLAPHLCYNKSVSKRTIPKRSSRFKSLSPMERRVKCCMPSTTSLRIENEKYSAC